MDGEEMLSNESPSYENKKEAQKVLSCIRQIRKNSKDTRILSTVCVVAFYSAQVREITESG